MRNTWEWPARTVFFHAHEQTSARGYAFCAQCMHVGTLAPKTTCLYCVPFAQHVLQHTSCQAPKMCTDARLQVELILGPQWRKCIKMQAAFSTQVHTPGSELEVYIRVSLVCTAAGSTCDRNYSAPPLFPASQEPHGLPRSGYQFFCSHHLRLKG